MANGRDFSNQLLDDRSIDILLSLAAARASGHTLYAPAKALLIKFSQALALEVRDHDVHVTALCPGFTFTEFHDVLVTRDIVRQLR